MFWHNYFGNHWFDNKDQVQWAQASNRSIREAGGLSWIWRQQCETLSQNQNNKKTQRTQNLSTSSILLTVPRRILSTWLTTPLGPRPAVPSGAVPHSPLWGCAPQSALGPLPGVNLHPARRALHSLYFSSQCWWSHSKSNLILSCIHRVRHTSKSVLSSH